MTDQYACLGAEDKPVCQEQHADKVRFWEGTWKASTPDAQKHNTAEQMPGAVLGEVKTPRSLENNCLEKQEILILTLNRFKVKNVMVLFAFLKISKALYWYWKTMVFTCLCKVLEILR